MDVKPWEPVSYSWNDYGWMFWEKGIQMMLRSHGQFKYYARDDLLYVTLANNQRIIVRALSEDRKAARAFLKKKRAEWKGVPL